MSRFRGLISDGTNWFVLKLTVVYAALGGAALTHPEWYSSGAYSWAFDNIMPVRGFALAWLALSLWGVRIIVKRTNELLLWVWAMAFVQMSIAASIFTLTWQGATGAFAGSVWWLLPSLDGWRSLWLIHRESRRR